MTSPLDAGVQATDSPGSEATPPMQNVEPQTTPTLINVFGQGAALTNGLSGLNIQLDDSSTCGPDGCY